MRMRTFEFRFQGFIPQGIAKKGRTSSSSIAKTADSKTRTASSLSQLSAKANRFHVGLKVSTSLSVHSISVSPSPTAPVNATASFSLP